MPESPLIVGAGPAGLATALFLADFVRAQVTGLDHEVRLHG